MLPSGCLSLTALPVPCVCRAAKEEAVANWNVALAFWELHLVQRCFLRWANHKQEALAMVLDRWRASSLRDCFL